MKLIPVILRYKYKALFQSNNININTGLAVSLLSLAQREAEATRASLWDRSDTLTDVHEDTHTEHSSAAPSQPRAACLDEDWIIQWIDGEFDGEFGDLPGGLVGTVQARLAAQHPAHHQLQRR